MTAPAPLLEIDNLQVEFRTERSAARVVRGVSFSVDRNETVGLVGESGSGKSVTALSVMRLLPGARGRVRGGAIRLDGQDLLGLPEREMRRIRGRRVAMVFQDPFSSLDPTMTVGAQVAEPIRLHQRAGRRDAARRAIELLRRVRIPDPELRARQYPHELSGGQRQRAMLATSFACQPDLLIADEPTTALDVTVQAQVLALMKEMQQGNGAGVLLITHDLAIVAETCDRIVVMYGGTVVESGPAEAVLRSPLHPYTEGLLSALPGIEGGGRRLRGMPGQPPDPRLPMAGCPFFDRCARRLPDLCASVAPAVTSPEPGRTVSCHLWNGDSGMRGRGADVPEHGASSPLAPHAQPASASASGERPDEG